MSTRFLKSIEHNKIYTVWLSGSKNKYLFRNNWPGQFEILLKTCDQMKTEYSFDRYIVKTLGQFQKAIGYLLNREWAKEATSSRRDVSDDYSFLRWFVRVGLTDFATTPLGTPNDEKAELYV